jgi:hypothetical protein
MGGLLMIRSMKEWEEVTTSDFGGLGISDSAVPV